MEWSTGLLECIGVPPALHNNKRHVLSKQVGDVCLSDFEVCSTTTIIIGTCITPLVGHLRSYLDPKVSARQSQDAL